MSSFMKARIDYSSKVAPSRQRDHLLVEVVKRVRGHGVGAWAGPIDCPSVRTAEGRYYIYKIRILLCNHSHKLRFRTRFSPNISLKSNCAVSAAAAAMPLHFPTNHHPSMIAPITNLLPSMSPQSIEWCHKMEQKIYKLKTQH